MSSTTRIVPDEAAALAPGTPRVGSSRARSSSGEVIDHLLVSAAADGEFVRIRPTSRRNLLIRPAAPVARFCEKARDRVQLQPNCRYNRPDVTSSADMTRARPAK